MLTVVCYLLSVVASQALFLHSGQPVSRYSDPLYDDEPTRLFSFELLSRPLDAFQGHGEVRLSNILPLPQPQNKSDKMSSSASSQDKDKVATMGTPPATTTTVGLDPRAHLYVWDDLKLEEGQTMKIEVKIRAGAEVGVAPTGTTLLPGASVASSSSSAPLKVTLAWYTRPSLPPFFR